MDARYEIEVPKFTGRNVPIAEIARPLQVSVVSFSHAASNSDHVVGTSTPASSNIDLL